MGTRQVVEKADDTRKVDTQAEAISGMFARNLSSLGRPALWWFLEPVPDGDFLSPFPPSLLVGMSRVLMKPHSFPIIQDIRTSFAF